MWGDTSVFFTVSGHSHADAVRTRSDDADESVFCHLSDYT